MFSKRAVYTEKGPAPLAGIYNQAIIAKDMVYCSGVIATDPATDDLIEGDIKVHTVGETGFFILAAGADVLGELETSHREPHEDLRGGGHRYRQCRQGDGVPV